MKKVSLVLSATLVTAMLLISCGSSFKEKSTSKEVIIGNQVWMTENLNVDKFRNGESIPQAISDVEWKKAGENKKPAWCYYNNEPANGGKYGKLYNWYAINDSRGLSPINWHIPCDEEWVQLSNFTNGKESGFKGLPGGYRDYDGSFRNIEMGVGYWWSKTKDNSLPNSDYAYSRVLGYNGDGLQSSAPMGCGFLVRCLRDKVSQETK